jgi:hypothetical protein
MTQTSTTLYRNAMADARAILGRKPAKGPHPGPMIADEDPLAWWCLVEILVGYARGEGSKPRLGLERRGRVVPPKAGL